MTNNKIENPEVPVPETPEMNDRDYLTDVLTTEKNMSNNYAIAINEASNDQLFNELLDIFIETKECARELFNLSFQKGWYKLEEAEASKVTTVLNEHQTKAKELPE